MLCRQFNVFISLNRLIFFSSHPVNLSDPAYVFNVILAVILIVGLLIAGLIIVFKKPSPRKSTLVFITDKRICISVDYKKKTTVRELSADMITGFKVINKKYFGKSPVIKVFITKNDLKKVMLKPRCIDFDDTVAALEILCHNNSIPC